LTTAPNSKKSIGISQNYRLNEAIQHAIGSPLLSSSPLFESTNKENILMMFLQKPTISNALYLLRLVKRQNF
jgi:hypothetical protein